MKITTIAYNKNRIKGNILVKCLLFWSAFMIAILGSNLLSTFFPKVGRPLVLGIAGSLSALSITYYFLKREGKSFADIGLRWSTKTVTRFISGFLIGSLIFAFMLFCLLIFTDLTLKTHPTKINWVNLIWSILPIIPLAFMEEIAYRSYPFVSMKSTYGLRMAFFVTAIGFALYHLLGGMNIIGCFIGPGVWAFVFGLAAEWSGGVALATGLHVALNFQQGVFGMKSNMQPIWELAPQEQASGAFHFSADNVGLILQLVILVLSILLVEWTIWQKRRST